MQFSINNSEQKKINYIFNQNKYLWLSILIIVVITFINYGNSIKNEYAGDDVILITGNTFTLAGLHKVTNILSDDGVIEGWLDSDKSTIQDNGFRKRYRPITQLTLATEVQFFGENPHISHLINILLYSIIGILIFIILANIYNYIPDKNWYISIPFLASILFICHPIHTEAVANIKSRDEILALLFSLLSLHFTIKYISKPKVIYLFITAICFLLALLSKEDALTFLIIIPIAIHFYTPDLFKNIRTNFRKIIYSILPLIISTVIFLTLTYLIVWRQAVKWDENAFSNYFINLKFPQLYGTIFYSLGKYLQLIILPYNLTCDYSIYQIPIVSIFNWISIVSIIAYLTLIVLAIKYLLKRNLISLGIFIYLIPILFYSNIFFINGSAVAERFLFLPSLGFCIVLGFIINKFIIWAKNKNVQIFNTYILIFIIIGLYSFKTITRNEDWKDSLTILKHDVKAHNNSANLNYKYAQMFYNEDTKKDSNFISNVKIAKIYYLKAANIYPEYTPTLNILGNCYYIADKNNDSAIYYYLRSLQINSKQVDLYKIIVGILDKIPDSIYCLNIYNKLIKLKPDFPILNYKLGKSYQQLNQNKLAIIYLEKALLLNSNYTAPAIDLIKLYKNIKCSSNQKYIYYLRIAEIYKTILKDTDNAIPFTQMAIKIYPHHAQAYFDLSMLYYLKGDKINCAKNLEAAHQYDPNNISIIDNLISLYNTLGNKEKYIQYKNILQQIK
jgi:tetratricopeptide (TPR) repeat protein